MMGKAKIRIVQKENKMDIRERGEDALLVNMLGTALAVKLAKCYVDGRMSDEGFEEGIENLRSAYEHTVCKMREAMKNDAEGVHGGD